MPRSLVRFACLSALAAFAASPALASVPSATMSTFPTCVRVVPGGNIVTIVIVRDLAGLPIPGAMVTLSYANCAGFAVCPGPGDAYTHDPVAKTISLMTNVVGSAPFYLRAGGGCVPSGLDISANGVFFGSARVVSADQDGDLAVTSADLAIETAKVGTLDLSGDVDCDG